MAAFLLLAVPAAFMVCGILLYRWGIHDGGVLRQNGNIALAPKRPKRGAGDEGWRDIAAYDHRKA